jgi:uncharacterized membrane protein (UPF0182 family)
LQRVIVSDGARAAMEPTLQAALEAVFGGIARVGRSADGSAPSQPPAELQSARDALGAAQQALAKGDWAAFGSAMQRLSETLGRPPAPSNGS